jgi:hypothetical protein
LISPVCWATQEIDMMDIEALTEGAIDILAIGGVVWGIHWLGREDGGSLADLFAIPLNPPWPRGVQEEEPQPWRIERLYRTSAAGEPSQRRPARVSASGSSTRPSIAAD